MNYTPDLWLGSAQSFQQYILNQLVDHPPVRFDGASEEESLSDFLAEQLLSIQGSVGILSVEGSLVNRESFLNPWMGRVAYSTISTAMNRLLEDDNIKSIVLAINSPGGDASGLYDLTTFVKDASKVKPVHAWTGTAALSAAYWLAASCKSVRCSDLAELGSVGAIATFTSVARMLKEEGIDVTVVRAGKFKAPLHPAETLSEQGKDHLQEKANTLHTYFVDNILKARPALQKQVKAEWAEGQVLFATPAIEIGLADGPPTSLSAFISRLNTAAQRQPQPAQAGVMNKQILLSEQVREKIGLSAEQALAQAQLGVPLADLVTPGPVQATDAPQEPEKPAEEAPDKPLEGALTTELLSAENPLVDYLKEQMAALQGTVTAQAAELAETRRSLDAALAAEVSLRPIAVEAIQRLQIALGARPMPLEGLPAATLVEQYAASKAEFEQWFKAGQRTVTTSDPSAAGKTLVEQRLALVQNH